MRSQRGDVEAIGVLVVLLIAAFAFVVWMVFGESYAEARLKAKAAVEAHGFGDVVIVEHVIFGCGEDDVYRLSWRGTTQAGKPVQGFACAGWLFKGWTVRVER